MVAVYPPPPPFLAIFHPHPITVSVAPPSPPTPSAQSLSARDKLAKMAARKLFISGNRFWSTRTLGFCSRRRAPWLRQMALPLIPEMLQCFISIYVVDIILLFVLSSQWRGYVQPSARFIFRETLDVDSCIWNCKLKLRRISLLIVLDIIPD